MVCRGRRPAWPALGDREQLGPALRTETDLPTCIKQTGFNYTVYTSSIFLVSLSGPAVIIPDVVVTNSSPCRGKLHVRISLILTFSKSMKSGAWPGRPRYQVIGISVNSPSWPRGRFLSSPANRSSLTHPHEVPGGVCFLPVERVLPDWHPVLLSDLCIRVSGEAWDTTLCLVAFPTAQTRRAWTWGIRDVGHGVDPWPGRNRHSGSSGCGLPSGARARARAWPASRGPAAVRVQRGEAAL